MRGLLIDSYDQKVTDLDLPDEAEEFDQCVKEALCCKSFIDTQSFVHSCTAFVDTTSLDNSLIIFIDQDCLINLGNRAFLSPMLPFPLFGNAVLVGRNLVTGEKEDLLDHGNTLLSSLEFLTPEFTDIARKNVYETFKGLKDNLLYNR